MAPHMQVRENTNVTPIEDAIQANRQKRKRLFIILALAIGIGSIIIFTYWKLVASKHVSTDDAYAAADIAQVTTSTTGIVKTIQVVDTQTVKTGDILVTLDDTDATLAVRQAEANLTRNKTDLERAQINFERRKKLAASGFLSAEELSNSESMLKVAQANVASANVSLDQARIDLTRTVIRAPVDGIIAKREVELGQRITAGTHLLSIIPISQIYVNANFKEVQLRKVKIGQPAEVHADIYGSSVTYHGHVAGISGGTGSAFAIIPAQNATGNWIKVVQRLPVRIELDHENLIRHPLQVGLSMQVDINVSK
jgi:membrane fusion protein (multidrug efflux system)